MKRYTLLLKSHCEAPDYVDAVFAKSRREAVTKLLNRFNRMNDNSLDMKTVLANMEEEDEETGTFADHLEEIKRD